MPASVTTEKDEDAWARAKAAVRSQYPSLNEDNDRFWALTQHIYGNMKALDASCAAPASMQKARRLALRPLRLRYVRRRRKDA